MLGTGSNTRLRAEIITAPPGWYAVYWFEPTTAGLLLSAMTPSLVGGLYLYDGTRWTVIACAISMLNWIEDYIAIDGSGVLYPFGLSTGIEPWRCAFGGGAAQVKNIYPPVTLGSRPHRFCAIGSRAFFAASDEDGEELWVTDGTHAGTRKVLDIDPGSASSSPREFTPFGDRVVFVATQAGRPTLWSSDGTAAGTTQIAGISFATELKELTPCKGLIVFCTDTNLWRTDGTNAGTSQLGTAALAPSQLTAYRDDVYFTAESSGYGRELWRTDGTTAGTVRVVDLAPGPASGLAADASMEVLYDRLYFAGYTAATGTELYRADSSPVGTVLVADIAPGAASSNPRGLLTFRSDPYSMAAGVLVFKANDGVHGEEYWVTTGTAASTALLYDIGPGAASGVSSIAPAVASDRAGRVYFPADDGVHGIELWRTNGTTSGTALLEDVRSGSAGSMPWSATSPLFLPGSFRHVLFAANDGTHGEELFLLYPGVRQMLELNPGPAGAAITEIARVRDRVLFGAEDGVHGVELFTLSLGEIAAPLVELVGGGCVGAHGLPLIDTEVGQLPRIGNSAFRMQAVSGPPQRAATLFIGLGLGDLPIGPCNFRGLPELFNIPTTTSADGMASVAVPIPGDPVLVGGAVTFQWVILDPTGGLFGLASLSDGMFAVIGV